MFYSQFILSKHGPLGTIWIAAHLERKLRKNQITETNITESVDSILYPEVPIALRLSGHLLLGVVRIYSRKVNYLFHDCSEALSKIRQAFYPSAVNLPPGAVVAPYHSITLPESFDFDELEARIDRENVSQEVKRSEYEHHVTARDLITLHDGDEDLSYLRSFFTLDERFLEGGNPYAILGMSNEEVAPQKSGSSKPVSLAPSAEEVARSVEEDVLPPLPIEEDMDLEAMEVYEDEDEVGHRVNEPGSLDVHEGCSIMPVRNEDLAQQAEAPEKGERAKTMVVPDVERLRTATEVTEQAYDIGLQELDGDEMDVSNEPLRIVRGSEIGGGAQNLEETPVVRVETTPLGPQRSSPMSPMATGEDSDILGTILGGRTPKLEVMPTPLTLRQKGRKRKQIFDDMMALPSSTMKKQLKSTSDICRTRKKAPSTEYEIWMSRRDNHMEQKFFEPSIPGMCTELRGIINRVSSGKRRLPAKALQFDIDTSKLQADKTRGEALNDISVEHVEKLRGGSGLDEPIHEVAIQLSEIEALSTPLGQQADFFKGKTVDTADEAQQGKPSSPTPQLPMDLIGAGKLEKGTEFIEKVGEHFQSSSAQKENRTVNRSAASLETQQDGSLLGPITEMPQNLVEVAKPEDLEFLADSRETDRDVNEGDDGYEQIGNPFENNSVWSSRTRAVAQYLQEKFAVMETARKPSTDQVTKLSLETLLRGRTHREAARLFYETLVLRTKDYLQVEQDTCYSDIHLFATRHLLKTGL